MSIACQNYIIATYEGEALEAFSGVDDLEAIGNALVHGGVGLNKSKVKFKSKAYLLAALDDIKGADGGVGKTTGENSTSHALGVVGCIVIIS